MQVARKYILNKEQVERKVRRLAFEIAERNFEASKIYFVAILENGVALSQRIAFELSKISAVQIQLIELSMDKQQPAEVNLSAIPSDKDSVIVLVDDVASSGKTMMYALKPLLNLHPKKIETLVLVERTHKAFPIQIDYVGMSVATTLEEHIFVEVKDGVIAGAYMN